MLKTLLVALVLMVLMPVPDVAYGQYYVPLRAAGKEQRKNDPFVFCRYGMNKRTPAWKPSPFTGGRYNGPWVPNIPFCPYPNTGTCCFGYVCFRPWPQEDFQAVFLYMATCAAAGSQTGKNWNGPGDGRRVDSNGVNVH